MRKIKAIVVHCSNSDNPKHDNVETIKEWHLARGFSDIGYHYVVLMNGDVMAGRSEGVAGAHVEGNNKSTIGICWTGRTKPTVKQYNSLVMKVMALLLKYELPVEAVKGHKEYNSGKTCPNLDMDKFRETVNVALSGL